MIRPDIAGIAPFFIVRNVPAALSFYRERLGFEVTFQGPSPDDIFFGIVERGAAMIMLKDIGVDPMPNGGRDIGKGSARWDAYVYVPDPDALATEFASRGVELARPLEDTHDGLRGFEIRDVDGYVLFFGRTRETRVRLRRATLGDVPVLERWDTDPDVISATTDDDATERAFGGLDWREELGQVSEASYYLIAEVDGRPIGAMQICDPHTEPTHYWGTIDPNLRAIDIWIGAEADRNQGYGREMMRLAHAHCFADPAVTAIVIDPLVSNTRAIAFYKRLGYEVVEQRTFGDDDCVVMRLTRDAALRS